MKKKNLTRNWDFYDKLYCSGVWILSDAKMSTTTITTTAKWNIISVVDAIKILWFTLQRKVDWKKRHKKEKEKKSKWNKRPDNKT